MKRRGEHRARLEPRRKRLRTPLDGALPLSTCDIAEAVQVQQAVLRELEGALRTGNAGGLRRETAAAANKVTAWASARAAVNLPQHVTFNHADLTASAPSTRMDVLTTAASMGEAEVADVLALQWAVRNEMLAALAGPPTDARPSSSILGCVAQENFHLDWTHRRELETDKRLHEASCATNAVLDAIDLAPHTTSTNAADAGVGPMANSTARLMSLPTHQNHILHTWRGHAARREALVAAMLRERKVAGDEALKAPDADALALSQCQGIPFQRRRCVTRLVYQTLIHLLALTERLAERRALVPQAMTFTTFAENKLPVQMQRTSFVDYQRHGKRARTPAAVQKLFEASAMRMYRLSGTTVLYHTRDAKLEVSPLLKPHQNGLFTFLRERFVRREHCVVADDVGCGVRTTLLAHLINGCGARTWTGRATYFIAAPPHEVAGWEALVQRWCSTLTNCCSYIYDDDTNQVVQQKCRHLGLSHVVAERPKGPFHLLVVAFSKLQAAVAALTPSQRRFWTLAVDYRSGSAVGPGAVGATLPELVAHVHPIVSRHRLLLTAAPPTCAVADRFAVFQFLFPRSMGADKGGLAAWLSRTANEAHRVHPSWAVAPHEVAIGEDDKELVARRLLQITRPFYRRLPRTAHSGLKQWSDDVRVLACPPSALQRRLYWVIAAVFYARFEEQPERSLEPLALGSALAKQLLEHPALLEAYGNGGSVPWTGPPESDPQKDLNQYIRSCGKLAKLHRLLAMAAEWCLSADRVEYLAIHASDVETYGVVAKFVNRWAGTAALGEQAWFLKAGTDQKRQGMVLADFEANTGPGLRILVLGTVPSHKAGSLSMVHKLVCYDTLPHYTLNALTGLCRPCGDDRTLRVQILVASLGNGGVGLTQRMQSIDELRRGYYQDRLQTADGMSEIDLVYLLSVHSSEMPSGKELLLRHMKEVALAGDPLDSLRRTPPRAEIEPEEFRLMGYGDVGAAAPDGRVALLGVDECPEALREKLPPAQVLSKLLPRLLQAGLGRRCIDAASMPANHDILGLLRDGRDVAYVRVPAPRTDGALEAGQLYGLDAGVDTLPITQWLQDLPPAEPSG